MGKFIPWKLQCLWIMFKWKFFWSHLCGLRFHDIDFSDLKIQNIKGFCPIIMLGGISEGDLYRNIIDVADFLKCCGHDDSLDNIMKSKRSTSGKTYVAYVEKKPSKINSQNDLMSLNATTLMEEFVFLAFKLVFEGESVNSIINGGQVLCVSSMINNRCVPAIRKNKKGLPTCGWRGRIREEGCHSGEMVRRVILL